MIRPTLTATAAVLSALLGLACGGDEHGTDDHAEGEPMTELVQAVDTEMSELQTLIIAHGEEVGSAGDLAALTQIEGVYVTDALARHEEMHHATDDMSACMHDEETPMLGPIDLTLEEIEKELNAHTTHMADAADLVAAQDEETRHQGAMAELMSSLSSEHDDLAAEGDHFMCAHSGDMHDDGHMH